MRVSKYFMLGAVPLPICAGISSVNPDVLQPKLKLDDTANCSSSSISISMMSSLGNEYSRASETERRAFEPVDRPELVKAYEKALLSCEQVDRKQTVSPRTWARKHHCIDDQRARLASYFWQDVIAVSKFLCRKDFHFLVLLISNTKRTTLFAHFLKYCNQDTMRYILQHPKFEPRYLNCAGLPYIAYQQPSKPPNMTSPTYLPSPNIGVTPLQFLIILYFTHQETAYERAHSDYVIERIRKVVNVLLQDPRCDKSVKMDSMLKFMIWEKRFIPDTQDLLAFWAWSIGVKYGKYRKNVQMVALPLAVRKLVFECLFLDQLPVSLPRRLVVKRDECSRPQQFDKVGKQIVSWQNFIADVKQEKVPIFQKTCGDIFNTFWLL